MNHRNRVLLCFFIACGALNWPVLGQSLPNSLPDALKTAAALDAAGETAITDFVSGWFKKLADPSGDVQRNAREALSSQARGGGPTGPSPAYLAKYSDVVNSETIAAMTDSKEIRVRINAAVVLARVAADARTTRLEKAILLLLDDKQPDSLKLWGVKAAKYIIPELVKFGGQQKLVDRILAVVKQTPNGSMTQDGYLAFEPVEATGAAGMKPLIEPLLTLLEMRIGMYKAGLPEDPIIDSGPFGWLVKSWVWNGVLTEKQKIKTMQLMCDMLWFCADFGDNPAHAAHREQLVKSFQQLSGYIVVVGILMTEPNLQNAAKPGRNAGSPLTPLVGPIIAEVKKTKPFEGIDDTKKTAPPSTTVNTTIP